MKTVDAYWEKRNLGVDVIEITCSNKDKPDDLEKAILKVSAPYSVIKIPSGRVDLLYIAQRNSYFISETLVSLEGNIKKATTPSIYDRFMKKIDIEPASENMRQKVLDEILEGSIFATDRIALDPMFSKKIAGLRYYNWCKDVLARGADLEVAYYDDTPIAFNVSTLGENETGVCDGLIGGVFSESANKGFGFLVVQCELETCKKYNAKKCLARVSSNNIPILRLHMQFGFDITDINYVLTKHIVM